MTFDEKRAAYAAAEHNAEELAAAWLTARASGDRRNWRTASVLLDDAMDTLRTAKNRFEKAQHQAEKAATLQSERPTE